MRGTAVGNWAKRGALVVTLCVGVACVAGSCAKLDQNGASVPQLRERMPSFAPVVQAVVPAVVNVTAVQSFGEAAIGAGSPAVRPSKYQDGTRTSSSSRIDELLRRFFDGLAEGAPSASRTAVGSGFTIDPSGYIVTEDHVIEGAQKVTVTFHDGTSHPARIVGRDIKTDLALLKIDVDRKLPHVDWGDSDMALVGDWVLAVGNPFGFDASVSGGIISGRGRNMHLGPYDDFLQIDAAINVGNSGGPTFDLDGRVIGINTAIYSPNGGSVGIAFAVPANLARSVIEQLMTGGRVARGWLGVRIQELTPEIASSLGLAKPEGGLVADVTPDGPAARAGFAPGDVVLSVDGRSVAKKRDLLVALAAMPAGRKAEMKVWHRGVGIMLHPIIDEMPETPNIISYAPKETRAHQDLGIGLKLGALTEARRQLLGISPEVKGVIVLETNESGMFAHLGLRPGDVIETINQRQAGSPESAIASLEKIQTSGADKVLMLIHRRGTNRFLAGSLRDSTN